MTMFNLVVIAIFRIAYIGYAYQGMSFRSGVTFKLGLAWLIAPRLLKLHARTFIVNGPLYMIYAFYGSINGPSLIAISNLVMLFLFEIYWILRLTTPGWGQLHM